MVDSVDGIILMAYGTPNGLDDVERYYTEILRSKKPSDMQLEKLKSRYASIGGGSRLLEITKSQASKLQKFIEKKGVDAKVYAGMKYSDPHITDAVGLAIDDGVDRIICIPVAPFYSAIGTGSYFEKADSAIAKLGYKGSVERVDSWYSEPGLEKAWVESVSRLGLDKNWVILFTAHSMPVTPADDLSLYRRQIIFASNSVQRHFGCKWSLSFQSAADLPGNWIGPDAAWQIKELAENGVKRLAIVPIGFVSANLETEYDVKKEYAMLCDSLGIECKIAEMPDDSDFIIEALYSAYSKHSANAP